MLISRSGTAYDLSGPKDGPVVVLIHGLGMNRQVTWGQIAPVLAKEYLVVSYDLLGHGQSAIPPEEVSLKLLSEQLIALLDELEVDQAALIGFSLGGMINRRVAIDHPDRVSALAILNSPHERGEEQQKLVEDNARDSSSGGPAAVIDAALARWFTEEFRSRNPDQVAAVRDAVVANDPDNYAAHRFVLANGVIELIRPDPPLSQPTLVMTCEHDFGSTPAMSNAIASEIKGAEVIIVPDLKHLGLIEDSLAFANPICGFLRRVIAN